MGRLSEVEFQKQTEQTLGELERAFAILANDRDLDVESESGVLSVTFEEGEPGRFIISPNSSAGQIWVSARLASYKFDWSEEKRVFVLSGTGEPIRAVLERLTREQLGDDNVSL